MSIKQFIKEEKFCHFFQPVYSLSDWKTYGHEGLMRSKIYPNPEYIFQKAKKEKSLFELDSLSIYKILSDYDLKKTTKKNGSLFINVLPSTILNPGFPTFINKLVSHNLLDKQKIVFEISESEKINDYNTFKERILDIKKMGFLISLDDVGRGFTNIKALIELEPNYLKLDGYLSHNLYQSKEKQTFISFCVDYCEKYNIKLILEGIETAADMSMAKVLGVHLGQGYILGKPESLKQRFEVLHLL